MADTSIKRQSTIFLEPANPFPRRRITIKKNRNDYASTHLVEGVVLALHVGVLDTLAKDVLVEGAREVALEQLVVVDGLGDDAADELEIAQVVRVAVRRRVDHIRDAVTRRRREQRVHWVEDLTRDDHVPYYNIAKMNKTNQFTNPSISIDIFL